MHGGKWRFCLDRGGTFTDVVALSPDGQLFMDKTPSDNISGGLQILRNFLAIPPSARIPAAQVADIRIGTTIATNMLLEKKGQRTALLVTRGFGDILLIGNQTRQKLFSLDIKRPPPLYDTVCEVEERVDAGGNVVCPPDSVSLKKTLTALHRRYDSITIAFMHACQYPQHERAAAALARAVGFRRITMSHEVSALMKYIPRAHTAVADNYLADGLQQYVNAIHAQCEDDVKVLFMQSNGVLAAADKLRAINTVLSGPAGGVVGMKKSARQAAFEHVIGLDMGGTSTDVAISSSMMPDTLRLENHIADIPLFVPMLDINTVAAGGGSVVHYTNGRLQVGPHSAGAKPGPACYRHDGPLTITDCNVLLGKLQENNFPAIFGATQDKPLDTAVVHEKFAALAADTGTAAMQLAEEFIKIAVEQMAGAIRRLAAARAIDSRKCILNGFGGAAGQHVCLIAEAAGMNTVLVPRQASVLSAWGISAADIGTVKNRHCEYTLDAPQLAEIFADLAAAAAADLPAGSKPLVQYILRCRYVNVDAELPIRWQCDAAAMRADFEAQHRARYGYVAADKKIVATIAEVRAVIEQQPPPLAIKDSGATRTQARSQYRQVYFGGRMRRTAFYRWDKLPPASTIRAPAVIYDNLNNIVVEPNWQACVKANGDIVLTKIKATAARQRQSKAAMIEIMNSRFSFVAEQMGEMLQQTAVSVNIRERLDFSCALFDRSGNLVANAPHIPVHLGSMSESVRHLHRTKPTGWERGDTFLLNSPYHGGTHLPDITVIRPGRFEDGSGAADFYVAARGHHTDVGGFSPGSMPAASRHIEEEGVLFSLTPVVIDGVFAEDDIRRLFAAARYPARSIDENISDLRAQLAAVAGGIKEMRRSSGEFGAGILRRYLRLVQQNAAAAAADLLLTLQDGSSCIYFDDGSRIALNIHIDRAKKQVHFDFSGTSKQHPANFNAPTAVVRAAVVYCLRVLLGENIPLNDGLLKPVRLRLPRASMLNPLPPAAVAAGNVEVSQNIVDAVFMALGVCANAQGSCNNVTIGSGGKQYYETIGGGMGGSQLAVGADAVQVHMTNSRASDPEVLEWNYPLRLETFAVRRGSGGGGRQAGGNGVIRRIRLLADGEINLLTSRRQQPPLGIAGGDNGQCGSNRIERKSGAIQHLAGCAQAHLQAGDCIVIETPGGGGFGKK